MVQVIASLVALAAGVVLMVIGDRKNRRAIGSGTLLMKIGFGLFAIVLCSWAAFGKSMHYFT